MGKRTKKSVAVNAVNVVIANAGDLLTALTHITAPAAQALGTVNYGAMYRTLSGQHTNKRGLFVASIIRTVAGDGTFDTLTAVMREFSVPAMRAECAYAAATGDATYFRSRSGEWCDWALPLVKDNAVNADASDDALAQAFRLTCPTNRANVNGMLTEITLAARKRNVTPLPVFADAVRYNAVTAYNAETHGADGYAARGYGHAVFTLPA